MRLSQKTLYHRAYVELQNHALPKLCLFVAKPISKERYATKRNTRPSRKDCYTSSLQSKKTHQRTPSYHYESPRRRIAVRTSATRAARISDRTLTRPGKHE